jgi:FdhD protein
MKEATLTYEGVLITSTEQRTTNDSLIVEEALSIFINAKPLTVTMQTPGHEMELARGLLYTEGIYKRGNEDWKAEVVEKNKQQHITSVNVKLNEDEISAISKRSLLSVAACGICGKTELDFVSGHMQQTVPFDLQKMNEMFAIMRARQMAFESSGGCHAAAAFNAENKMLSIMEDVGRHNAVDKVVGDLLFKNTLKEAKYLLVSGRVSYELIAKTFAAGIPLLAAVSAPSSLAVDFAKELGITLFGFCRGDRMTRYS